MTRPTTAGALILALAGSGAWGIAKVAANRDGVGEQRSMDGAPLLGTRDACERYAGLPGGWPDAEHAGMVWVEGGTFTIGSRKGYIEERSASDPVTVAGFWIDRAEVTNAQFAAFVSATGYITEAERNGLAAVFEPAGTRASARDGGTEAAADDGSPTWWRRVDGTNWRHPDGPASTLEGRANQPVVQVTQVDASAYARWLGRTLPSEVQWEFAARAGGAPDDGTAPVDEDGRPTANYWQGKFPTENLAADGYSGRAPVGCFSPNRLGVYDMIGNVWELTGDAYRGQRPAHCTGAVEGPQDLDEEPSVIKGGSFLCAPSYCARYRASARHPHEAHLAAAHVGFRTVINDGK